MDDKKSASPKTKTASKAGSSASKSAQAKKSSTTKAKAGLNKGKSITKEPVKTQKKTELHEDSAGIQGSELNEGIPDNVRPLYPEAKETPLAMQPQVWIATAIAALALLFVIKKRK